MTTDETLRKIQNDTAAWKQKAADLLRQQQTAINQIEAIKQNQPLLDEHWKRQNSPTLTPEEKAESVRRMNEIIENTNRARAEEQRQQTLQHEANVRQWQESERLKLDQQRQQSLDKTRLAADDAFNNYQQQLQRQKQNDIKLPEALRELERAKLEAQKAAADLRDLQAGKLPQEPSNKGRPSQAGGGGGGGGTPAGPGSIQLKNNPAPAFPAPKGPAPGPGPGAGPAIIGPLASTAIDMLFNNFMQNRGFKLNPDYKPFFGPLTPSPADDQKWIPIDIPPYSPVGPVLSPLFPIGDDPTSPLDNSVTYPPGTIGVFLGKFADNRDVAHVNGAFTWLGTFSSSPDVNQGVGLYMEQPAGIGHDGEGTRWYIQSRSGSKHYIGIYYVSLGNWENIRTPNNAYKFEQVSWTPLNPNIPPVDGPKYQAPTYQAPPPGRNYNLDLGGFNDGGNAPPYAAPPPTPFDPKTSNPPAAPPNNIPSFTPRGNNNPGAGGLPGGMNAPGANFNPAPNPFPEPGANPSPGDNSPGAGGQPSNPGAQPLIASPNGGVTTPAGGATKNKQTLGEKANEIPSITTPTQTQPNKTPANEAGKIPQIFPPLVFNPNNPNTAIDNTAPPKSPPSQTPPEGGCCKPTLQKLDEIQKSQNNLGQAIQNNALDALIKVDTTEILNRMGPQVPGGLSGFLGDKFTKLWKSKAIDRALALLNLAASLHNAAMLSRNLATTLGQVIENILATIGIKDPDENVRGLSELIGNTVEGIVKAVIGEQNYIELTTAWKKANIIYTAAINTYQLLNDSFYAIAEGMELIGKYNAKIGNALKKGGVVLESAYDWMSETFNFKSKRNNAIEVAIENLQQANNIASDLEEITSNFREATENLQEIKETVDNMKSELTTAENNRKTQEAAAKTGSQSADITIADIIKNL